MLGVGWNFGFVGASALVLETHLPQEKNKVQAFNDFLVFGIMAIGSFSSGQLLANYGWNAVNLVVFPPVLLGLIVLALSFAKRRARLEEMDEFPDPSISALRTIACRREPVSMSSSPCRSGDHAGAIERYYTEDASMQENAAPPRSAATSGRA